VCARTPSQSLRIRFKTISGSIILLIPKGRDYEVEVEVKVEAEVEVNLRPTASRPVCLGVRRPSGTCDRFFFLLEISFGQLRVCYFVVPSLTRGRVCNLL
jgi:hypothetical protein